MSIIKKKITRYSSSKYLRNKINAPFYVYVYLSIIPKKKNYKVLELGELEYLRNKINALFYVYVYLSIIQKYIYIYIYIYLFTRNSSFINSSTIWNMQFINAIHKLKYDLEHAIHKPKFHKRTILCLHAIHFVMSFP